MHLSVFFWRQIRGLISLNPNGNKSTLLMFNRVVLEEHAQSDSCRLPIVRVCVCVCIKGMTDSLSELNTGSKLYSNHTVNNNEKLICSAHTHAYALASSGSVHAASIWERYVTNSSSIHNRFILLFYSVRRSSLSLSQQVIDSAYVRQTHDWNNSVEVHWRAKHAQCN